MLLEESIVNQMSASAVLKEETQQPIDSLTYKTFVKNFNEEYSEVLNEQQKNLLGKYISSFADNGLDFKIYLNEEIARLKEGLVEAKSKPDLTGQEDLREKLDKVFSILDETKNRPVDTETLEIILNTQQILEEINKDDD